jgi:hypothetical protein
MDETGGVGDMDIGKEHTCTADFSWKSCPDDLLCEHNIKSDIKGRTGCVGGERFGLDSGG